MNNSLFVTGYSIENSKASIFSLKNENGVIDRGEQLLIYGLADDFKRQFLFLPMPLLAQTTNIREIAVMAISRIFGEQEICEDNVIGIIDQIHAQIHELYRWRPGKIDLLRFLRSEQEVNEINLHFYYNNKYMSFILNKYLLVIMK